MATSTTCPMAYCSTRAESTREISVLAAAANCNAAVTKARAITSGRALWTVTGPCSPSITDRTCFERSTWAANPTPARSWSRLTAIS